MKTPKGELHDHRGVDNWESKACLLVGSGGSVRFWSKRCVFKWQHVIFSHSWGPLEAKQVVTNPSFPPFLLSLQWLWNEEVRSCWHLMPTQDEANPPWFYCRVAPNKSPKQ